MRFKLEYFTFLVYTPRGTSPNAELSRKIVGQLKKGSPEVSRILADKIKADKTYESFFENATLIPIPRSTPLKEGVLFPAKIIAETLISEGLGINISTCLKRSIAIPPSKTQYTADERNKVSTHINSLAIDADLAIGKNIILVDDVMTLGRTSYACAIKLLEVYPEASIKFFSVLRTRSFEDNNILIQPQMNFMQASSNDGVILPD